MKAFAVFSFVVLMFPIFAGPGLAQNATCPDTHYQCSPGVCCPR